MGQSSCTFLSCCDEGIALPEARPPFSDLPSDFELERGRLQDLLRGIDANALQALDSSGGMNSDVLLRIWEKAVEVENGQVDVEDRHTMRAALALYRKSKSDAPASPSAANGRINVGSFWEFASEEAQDDCTSGSRASAYSELRRSVSRDLRSLHMFLNQFCKDHSIALGPAPRGVVSHCMAELISRFSGRAGLSPDDVLADAAEAWPGASGEDAFDLSTALFHALGRRATPVELVLYDISQGALRLLSPLLFGQQFEAIYHSSVLVHGTEYWYGGHVFENEPPLDARVFGAPLADSLEVLEPSTFKPGLSVVRLGFTWASPRELRAFLHTEMKAKYRPDNYDVLSHNCNNFSDEVVTFLTGAGIPSTIRELPALLMSTPTARFLRPLLNKWLRGFHSSTCKAGGGGDGGEGEDEDDEEDERAEEDVEDQHPRRRGFGAGRELRIWDDEVALPAGGAGEVAASAGFETRRRDARRRAIKRAPGGQLVEAKLGARIVEAHPALPMAQQRGQDFRRLAFQGIGHGQLVEAKVV